VGTVETIPDKLTAYEIFEFVRNNKGKAKNWPEWKSQPNYYYQKHVPPKVKQKKHYICPFLHPTLDKGRHQAKGEFESKMNRQGSKTIPKSRFKRQKGIEVPS
jgi:hypothetical protein